MPMPADRVQPWMKQWRHYRAWQQLGDLGTGPTSHYDLNVAILSHRLWMDKLSWFCKTGKKALAPELNANECQFARWYRGIGAARYRSRANFEAIGQLHQEIHRAAQTLHSNLVKSSSDAGEIDVTKIRQKSDELTALLMGLASQKGGRPSPSTAPGLTAPAPIASRSGGQATQSPSA